MLVSSASADATLADQNRRPKGVVEDRQVELAEARGAANANAKRELGWTLRYPSWRQGVAQVYARPTATTATAIPTPARS